MRREFKLMPEDREFLENSGLQWLTIKDNSQLWVIIEGYDLPIGYVQKKVDIAFNIPSGYPRSQLDMVYFSPAINRIDSKSIPALSSKIIDNETWQRWSRHRTTSNPWREGVDNISTHFALIEFWLIREFKIRPYEISA